MTDYRIAERLLSLDEALDLTLVYGEVRATTKIDPGDSPALEYLKRAVSTAEGCYDKRLLVRWKQVLTDLLNGTFTRKGPGPGDLDGYGHLVQPHFSVLHVGPLCVQAIYGNTWYAVIGWPFPGDTAPVRCWGQIGSLEKRQTLLWVTPSYGYLDSARLRLAAYRAALGLRGVFNDVLDSVS